MITYQLVNSNLFKLKPLDQEIICEEIEEIVLASGLDPSKRMTLRTKKGSYHWHLKKQKEKGVLEITYWPSKERLLLEIHQNRRANWNEEMIETLSALFEDAFGGVVIKNV
ncbi:hypothetical protein JCM19046_652 [Bacillus sp. JCM 19046]|nr:hypothetical protein JCM19045_1084 [Bacillus sp. JCM 19045]GAF16237.1 hypothetical protein JCM19046_652 [Bacillus sp. JCM 19046]